jgi:hypothetical protein
MVLYQKIIDLKKERMKNNEMNSDEVRTTSFRKEIKGAFVFDLSRKTLSNRFKTKFLNLVPGFKIRAKDVRM